MILYNAYLSYSQGYLTATSYAGQTTQMTKEFRKGKRYKRMESYIARRQRAFRLTIKEKAKFAAAVLFGTPVVITIVAYLWRIALHAVLA